MFTLKYIRILLFPISLLYGIIVFLYHMLYDLGVLPSKRFNIPVISVGNLTVGGTGKTPHIEYLIRLFKKWQKNEKKGSKMPEYGDKIATLSRGYGRSTSGFILANETSTVIEIGDEPRQLKQKFREIKIAVDENRVRGIKKLIKQFPGLDVILLDDAFQHRAVKPGISILLMNFNSISSLQMLLPAGNMREWKWGAKRADIIVVTNSPSILSPLERRRIQNQIRPKHYQKLFFSYVKYGDLSLAFPVKEDFSVKEDKEKTFMMGKNFYFERDYSIILVTGIANPQPLKEYYQRNVKEFIHLQFSDHHEYSKEDIVKIQKIFDNIVNQNKIILTTEKDAMRFAIPGLLKIAGKLPIFYIPIEVAFHNNDGIEFNKYIIDYVTKNQRYNQVHTR